MAILDYIGSIGRILKGLSPSKNLTFFTNVYSQWLGLAEAANIL